MENAIVDLSLIFSVEIVAYTETLGQLKKHNISNQLFRSGTSIGANVNEAQGAESISDFIHKMRVAYKEAKETRYWLLICKQSTSYPDPGSLLNKIQDILNILGKILISSRKRQNLKI